MPIRCYRRPNRTEKRVFTRSDAVRIICAVVSSDDSKAGSGLPSTLSGFGANLGRRALANRDIDALAILAKARCGAPDQERQEQAQVAVAAGDISAGLESIQTFLSQDTGFFFDLLDIIQAVLVGVAAFAAVARFIPIPQVRAAGAAAGFLAARLEGFVGKVEARKAANDASFTLIRDLVAALAKKAA